MPHSYCLVQYRTGNVFVVSHSILKDVRFFVWIEVLRLTKILCFFMVFWLISAAIKASYIKKVENIDTSQIHKLSIQKALELHKSTIFQSRVFEALEFFNAMVGWTALNSYSNKSSQPKRKLLLFPSGFTPHYYIRIKSQDYNKTDNAIALDHFQIRTLHYQNLWKKSSGKGVGEGYLSLLQTKSLLQTDLYLSTICRSTSFKETKLALLQTKWKL